MMTHQNLRLGKWETVLSHLRKSARKTDIFQYTCAMMIHQNFAKRFHNFTMISGTYLLAIVELLWRPADT